LALAGRPLGVLVPLLVLVAVFALLGALVLGLAVVALLEEFPGIRRLRPARVQLSAHPLRPGGAYELAVQQPGPARLRVLRVVLLCETHVPYPDGEGGTYDKIETAFEAELLRREELRVEGGAPPFTARCPFSLPEDVPPSRDEEPRQVRWKVVVRGRQTGFPLRFAFDYPVAVFPVAG
jgi:hypothetical protein